MAMLSDQRVLLTGGAGFLGRAVQAVLASRGVTQISVVRKREHDLTRQADVERLFSAARPDVVIHLAAEVGGIGANQRNPGRYFYANMAMALNLIEQSRVSGVARFVQVGTICAYPKFTPVPFKEEELWNGYPEETNAPYGIAKKAALVMLQAYRDQYGMKSAYPLPVNLYGPYDNFDLETSHVIPALIRKFVEAVRSGAKSVTCWGTGAASREFLYVDDCAEAVIRAAERIDDPVPINLGTGAEITIRDLATQIAHCTGFTGTTVWDSSRPDGQPRRCLDTARAKQLLGWQANTTLADGLARTVEWYMEQD
jgi:GDP-L-fucose synthase